MNARKVLRPITTEEERDGIYRSLGTVAKANLPSDVFVELGVRRAGSSYEIFRRLKKLFQSFRYFGVDIDQQAKGHFNSALSKIVTPTQCATFILGKTVDVVGRIPSPVAWVFVDACHCQECCGADCETYGNILCPGGHLVVHDTTSRRQHYSKLFQHGHTRPFGVYQYVTRSTYLRSKFKMLFEIDSTNGLRVYERIGE